MFKSTLIASLLVAASVSLVACKPAESGNTAAKGEQPATSTTVSTVSTDNAQGGEKK
jgi:ABC-type oligopeptide transport system substrate-binding subunit